MDKDQGRSQAIAQVESIKEMVAALNVDYERLEELRELNEDMAASEEEDQEFRDLLEAAGECKSRDDAERRIDEDPLCIEVREPWHSIGEECLNPDEFRIVLCTGGPHVEIQGDLDDNGQPWNVRVLYQDWFTSKQSLEDFDRDAVLRYCQQFYFGV